MMSTESRRQRLGIDGKSDAEADKVLEAEHARRAAEEAAWEIERAKIKAAKKQKPAKM
jgi:hypothetical protein